MKKMRASPHPFFTALHLLENAVLCHVEPVLPKWGILTF